MSQQVSGAVMLSQMTTIAASYLFIEENETNKKYSDFDLKQLFQLPEHHSLFVHSLIGCNLHCFGCHNYEEVVSKKHEDFFSEEEMIQQIKQNGNFFDAMIFSGGEFLLEKKASIIRFLERVRIEFHGLVMINTNGTFPEKIETLIQLKLVDGFHLDMKLPYHILDIDQDKDTFQAIMDHIPTKSLLENLLTSLDIVIKHNSPYSQIRTVKYPILDHDYFEKIADFVKLLNKKHHSQVEYKLNEFLDVTYTYRN